MRTDTLLVPGSKRPRERHDAEPAPCHTGREHRGFGHTHDGNIKQLSRGKKPGVAKCRNDGGIDLRVSLREHLDRDGPADLRFGARRYIRHAARRGEGDQQRSGRGDGASNRQHQFGDVGAGIGIEQKDLHGQAAGRLRLVLPST